MGYADLILNGDPETYISLILCYTFKIYHRRTVHPSVGGGVSVMLAGRLSDKMSSELDYYSNVVVGGCFYFSEGLK